MRFHNLHQSQSCAKNMVSGTLDLLPINQVITSEVYYHQLNRQSGFNSKTTHPV